MKTLFSTFLTVGFIIICSSSVFVNGQSVSIAQIGDKVWEDFDGNGLQDANEPGIDSMVIKLFDCQDADNPIATTLSDQNGNYVFAGLSAGDYQIKFEVPPFFNYTTTDQGNDDTIDSDAGQNGFTTCITIGAEDTINTVDAGFVPCTDMPTLFCNPLETVSMDADCEEEVLIDLILEGDDLCWNLYEVEVFWNGQSYGNTLTSDHVGDTVEYIVTHIPTGNVCDGELAVIDNLAPVIAQCDSVWINCGDPLHPDSVGGFFASDNCSDVQLSFTDSIYPGGCNQPFVRKIRRMWEVSDQWSNETSCTQFIFEQRPTLADVFFPPNLDGIQNPGVDCNDQATEPDVTGWPTINGKEIQNGNVCGLKAFYFDQESPGGCESTLTILRSWTVLEVCSGESVVKDQVIEVVDETGPSISCPGDIVVGTNVNTCSADIFLPDATLSDNCSSENSITVFVVTPFDTLFDNGGWLLAVPQGNYSVTYFALDDCGNANSCSISITVNDNVAPVGIGDQQTQVSVGQDGDAVLCWSVFDDISYDNCGVVAIKLKREDAPFNVPFTDCVSFNCEDVGDTITVRVRIYDMEGTYTEDDPIGRFNEVTVEVSVKDALPPIIACPSDLTLDCWEDYEDIVDLPDDPEDGYPVYMDSLLVGYYEGVFDNCGVDSVSIMVQENINNCGTGTVSFVWTVVDVNGLTNACIQNITLTPADPFYISDTDCNDLDPNDGVIWPCDYFIEECNAGTTPSITGEPIVNDGFCELIGVNYEDTHVAIQDTACFKIIRDWLLLDWCQPDSNSPYGYVYWEYTQEIKVLDNTVPEILDNCQSFTVCSEDADCGPIPVQLVLDASDACTPFEDLNFFHTIDIFDDGGLDIQGTGNDASGLFPIGTHRIKWKVEDGCGNLTDCEYTFTVEDCKAPTPVCLNLSTSIGSSSQIDLPASAFNDASSDNCTGPDDLLYSFSPDPADTVRVFDCFDYLDGPNYPLEIYVTDEFGNQDVCSVEVLLTDPFLVCDSDPTTAGISGSILTEDDDPVSQVDVDLSNNPGGNILSTPTNVLGAYSFQAPLFQNYTITPFKNDNPVIGITTLDLVLINQHILGLDPLDSPYKIIAADASNDGVVTGFDLIEIRKLILQITQNFSNNHAFRFVDKTYVFPNPTNPFFPPYPEVININFLEEEELEQDFVGIKIGDVNNSYGLVGDDPASRENTLTFTASDQVLASEEKQWVRIFTTEDLRVEGLQWTLSFNPEKLNIHDIRSELPGFSEETYSLHKLEEGVIPFVWVGRDEITPEIPLLEIEISATEEGKLMNWLAINSDWLTAEVYQKGENGGNIQRRPIQFSYSEDSYSGDQNTLEVVAMPNPFTSSTQLGISIGKSSPYSLVLTNLMGSIIYSEEGILTEGYQQLSLSKDRFPSTGMYVVHIQTELGEVVEKVYFIE